MNFRAEIQITLQVTIQVNKICFGQFSRNVNHSFVIIASPKFAKFAHHMQKISLQSNSSRASKFNFEVLWLLLGLWFCLPQVCLADEIRQEDLNSSLIYAVRQGDMQSFNMALGLGANINAVDKSGNNAVLSAVEGEQHQLLRLLLEKHVSPNVRGGSGYTPLALAVLRNSSSDVAMLLKAGADPDLRTASGAGPTHLAAEFPRSHILGQLLDARVAIDNLNAMGETALIVAIRNNNAAAFDLLLAHGAAPSAMDKTGRSALFWAILENHEAMAVSLLEHGAGFYEKSDGYTPLTMARIMNHSHVLLALSLRGAKN